MIIPYVLAAAATQAFAPVAGHAQNTRLQNTRVLRGGQAQASVAISEAALAGLEPSEATLASWLSDAAGQSHLLAGWEEAAVEDKRRLLSQVAEMDAKYPSDAQVAVLSQNGPKIVPWIKVMVDRPDRSRAPDCI